MPNIRRDLVERYKRNREFFRTRLPVGALPPEGAAAFQVAEIGSSGELVDIRVGTTRLYGGSVHELVQQQLTDLLAPRGRYRPPLMRATPEDDLLFESVSNLDAASGESAASRPVEYAFPEKHGPLVIALGVGLGLHLPKILEAFEVRHLVVYEPTPLFLDLSCYAVDWRKIASRLQGDINSFHLLTGPDGDMNGRAIIDILRAKISPSALTGAILLKHYGCEPIERAVDCLRAHLPLVTQVPGYFKDQIRQVSQMVESLKMAHRSLKSRASPQTNHSLFVLGAGPSLTRGLPLLAKVRSHVTVFTCGSALRPVLNAGIVPDLHVELETDPTTLNVLDSIGHPDLLKSIPVVTTTGAAAETNARFESTCVFMREGSAAGDIVGNRILSLPCADPLVGNAATSLGVSLGFRRVFLMGIDCGFRSKRRHHAEGTVYADSETGEMHEDYRHIGVEQSVSGYESDIAYFKIPSVVGDEITANETFLASLRTVELLISTTKGLLLTQIGDGARIAGAKNVSFEEFSTSVFEKETRLGSDQLIAPFAPLGDEDRDVESQIRLLAASTEHQARVLVSLMRPAPTTLGGVVDRAQRALNAVNLMRKQGNGATATLFAGPLQGFFQILVGRCACMSDKGDVRREIEAAAIEFEALLDRLVKRTHAALMPRD